ncbi:MAG: hypothetical protein XD56_1955, partial [Pseudothermotoga lettingae]
LKDEEFEFSVGFRSCSPMKLPIFKFRVLEFVNLLTK